MNKLNDLVTICPSAEPYINFEKSLKSDPVCSGFVPVQSTLDVFAFLEEATATHATSRAAICYGTYGSGKSRLCVVLARLLSEGFDAQPLKPVWDRMDKRGWGDHLKDLRDVMCPGGKAWRPWLVVPMYEAAGGSTLDNALLHNLIRAVKEQGLPDDVLGVTIYEAAARRLEHMIADGRTFKPDPMTPYPTAESLIRSLREDASQDALKFFKKWHMKETAGMTLDSAIRDQPHLSGNAAQLYANVADAITAYGYEGVAVIWDEFGFAIEELLRGAAHGHRGLGREVMDLQNFVEQACGGGGLSGKVVFLGFTHVSLNEYGARADLNEQEQNRLTVVSGRFRNPDIPIRLSVTEAEGYHLLGGMKELTPEGSKLLANEFPCMRALARKMPSLPVWEQFSPEQCYNDIIKTAYPLHPAAASVLIMLSDRIAQVNRTAFYFMHDKDNGGVAGQIEDRQLPEQASIGSTELLRVSDVFKFFEQAMREHDPEIFHRYEEALVRFPGGEEIDEAVIRTVLILKAANVSPTTGMLAFCICDASSEETQAAPLHASLERCVKANTLWRNEATNVWDFGHSSSVDVEEPIEEELASIPAKEAVYFVRTELRIQEELAEYLGTFDMEPAESGIVRRVRVEILDTRNGKEGIKPVNPAVKSPGEGWCSAAINIIVAETEEAIRNWRRWVEEMDPSCSYFLIPQTPVVLNEDTRRFLAILRVLDKGNLDKSRREILDAMFTSLRGRLRKEFARYFGSEGFKSGECSVMKAGSSATISGITCWNDLLLRVAEDASRQFPREAKVRCGSYNEWADGRRLAPIEKIVDRIINFDDTSAYHTKYLGFKETAQEAAIVDGVLAENEYLTQDMHGKWVLGRASNKPDETTLDVIQLIRQHFTKGGGTEKPFVKLFSQLIEPSYGIPNGVIPILVAYALRDDLDRVALYVRRGGNSQRITKAELRGHLAELGCSPDRYSSRYEQLSGKNRYVFKALGTFHRILFTSAEASGEPFYAKCREIRKVLVGWAKGLQDVAASSSELTDVQREFIKSLRGPVPPQLPELAETAVKVFCEDADCEAELSAAGGPTTDFPHMRAYWDRLRDTLGRVSADAQAPVRNLLERMTDGGKIPLQDVLAPLRSGNGAPFVEPFKKLIPGSPGDIEHIVGAICDKLPASLGPEDYGIAKGVLQSVDLIRPKGGEVRLLLPDRTMLLPPVGDERGKPELEKTLAELRAEHNLSPEHIARLVLDLLFLGSESEGENTGTAAPVQ